MFIDTINSAPYALLLLRIIIALVFFTSGKLHVQKPIERSAIIGISPLQTSILGVAEIIGGISIALGLFTQLGSIILIICMIGAIYKKIAIWKMKFFEKEGHGWHYDLLLMFGLLVIFATDGGKLTIN